MAPFTVQNVSGQTGADKHAVAVKPQLAETRS